ncbi:uncharacterized protein [Scyliorhinus torazame]|uniref:uncharacterized protein isoform X2 n=1 Tax=Scyliorhinus torazame TaxID=75743 RepID=UPI003B5BA6E7
MGPTREESSVLPGLTGRRTGWTRIVDGSLQPLTGPRAGGEGPGQGAAMTKHRPLSLGGQASLAELSLQGSSRILDPSACTAEGIGDWESTPLLWRREVPLSMPWSRVSRGAMTFTGSMMPASREIDFPGMMKIKRRNEADAEGPSRKHFVSEEAMAARFTCLSLSNDHVYGSNGFPVAKGEDPFGNRLYFHAGESRALLRVGEEEERKDVIVEGMFDMSDSRVIVMSPDLQRRVQGPPDDILPRELLQSMSHPCMELILWQSPGHLIQRAIRALRLGMEAKPMESEMDRRQECPDTSLQGDQMEL